MKRHGGKRSGAGRKKGSLAKRTVAENQARIILVNKISDNYDEIIETLLMLGLGDWQEGEFELIEGHGLKLKKVYTQKPSQSALETLLAYSVGKPKQGFEIEGELNNPAGVDATVLLANSIRDILQSPKKAKKLKKVAEKVSTLT